MCLDQKYEGHLKRLIKLKVDKPKEHNESVRTIKATQLSESTLPMRKGRLKTEAQQMKKQASKSSNVGMPKNVELPLVPFKERQLVSKSLQTVKAHNREAEILLENYLLSRRILKTKPCIRSKEFEKSFKNHQRYLSLRSQSRILAVNLSQSRLQKFKQFQLKEKSRDHANSPHGSGRFIFRLQIRQIQTISRSSEEGKLYNLLIRLGNKTHKYSHLSFANLRSMHSFQFTKRQASRGDSVRVEIEVINQNEIHKYVEFKIDVSKAMEGIRDLYSYEDYQYDKPNQINALLSTRNEKIIGTILYDYWICTNA